MADSPNERSRGGVSVTPPGEETKPKSEIQQPGATCWWRKRFDFKKSRA
jgi:hypothetical protein